MGSVPNTFHELPSRFSFLVFRSSKDRQGGKSYVDIHSLFAPEGEGDGGSKSEEGAQEGS